MPTRPYIVLSCAVSADGCLDDASPRRLILSGPGDLDEVDALRAGCDAILVGAGTVRADNPRLRVRSADRVAAREAAGRPPHPLRAVLTSRGDLDPAARIFADSPRPLVYRGLSLAEVLEDLSTERGIGSVLVEGGSRILRDALAGDLADELRLAVAPFFVGDPDAPRFGLPARYPQGPERPMRLESVRSVEGVAVLAYRLSDRPRPPGLPPLDPPLAPARPRSPPVATATGPKVSL
ncbi:MAG: dihydrofolate reductase family protein [Streptosporangiales bacterium]|nr:dihydrofolate reductase family protein [Streptosporangiales bacterium]